MKITFDDTKWGSATAIMAIYFSRMEGKEPKNDYLLIGRYIRARLDGRPTQSFRLSEKQENEIDKIFAKLNSEFEFIDVHYKAKSLTWLRFAFQALRLGLQPSGAYLREYSVWRAERAAKYGFEIIEYTNDGTNRKPQRFSLIDERELCGHTLDEFLLKRELCFDPFQDENYLLVKAKYKKQNTSVALANDDPDTNTTNIPVKRKRDIRVVVGRKNYEKIRDLVNDALETRGRLNKLIRVRGTKEKGRFRVENISRDKFIDLLIAKHPDFCISASVIRRAITDFIAFDQYHKN